MKNDGAIVLITRPGLGQGALKENFFEWVKKHPSLTPKISSPSEIFRKYYNREDLKERAKKINEFSPDITIVIHYNSHLSEEEKKNKALLTDCNYNLAFIPGAFCTDELSTSEARYEFLRLIVTDQLQASLNLSESIIEQFEKKLCVPLLSEHEKISYIDHACLMQKKGIYSRNLALTRLVHSPLCYGETLIQNNQQEIYKLSERGTLIENLPCPQRVKDVAEAYYEGIKAYYSHYKL